MYSSIYNKKQDYNEIKTLQEYIKSANNFEELEMYDSCERAYNNCCLHSNSLNQSEIFKKNEFYKNFMKSLNQHFNQKISIMQLLIYFMTEKKNFKIEENLLNEKKNQDLIKLYESNINDLKKILEQIDKDLKEIETFEKDENKKMEQSYIQQVEGSIVIIGDKKNIDNNLNLKKNNYNFEDKEKLFLFLSNIKECLDDIKEKVIKLENYYEDILKYQKAKISDDEKLKKLKEKYKELDKKRSVIK